jgi:hypothetical protein
MGEQWDHVSFEVFDNTRDDMEAMAARLMKALAGEAEHHFQLQIRPHVVSMTGEPSQWTAEVAGAISAGRRP